MDNSWIKVQNKDGMAYYINEHTKVHQWSHPKFADIRQRLDDCNYVKYSMYRVALKFRVLQNALFMDEVPLSVIIGVFSRHRLGVNKDSLPIKNCDLEAILSDIYFASSKINHTNIVVDFATDLLMNFLYDVYDKDRQGLIQVSSVKLALYILSSCPLIDLYKWIFHLYADHNYCLTRVKLQMLLNNITEIMTYLHEDNSYGSHLIADTIEDCFKNTPDSEGISESAFISWLEQHPKLFSWIPLLHRIKKAEPVIHGQKCTTCKSNPLIGLRYKCTKCLRYTQCQRCFFAGRTSRSHKLTHPMREYATEIDAGGYTFIKRLCSLLSCSRREEVVVIETKPLCDQNAISKTQSKEVLCNIQPLSSPENQLQLVIKQLELQNKELQELISLRDKTDRDIRQYLEDHHLHIADQIQKLKILKEYLNVPASNAKPQERARKHISESTPMVQDCGKKKRVVEPGIELFSPIVPETNNFVANKDLVDSVKDNSPSENFTLDQSSRYCMDDTNWIAGQSAITSAERPVTNTCDSKTSAQKFQNDLDEALVKLQQILANNFSLDESLGPVDNTNLKYAVSEVEGMLTSIIDNVESSRSSIRSKGGAAKIRNNKSSQKLIEDSMNEEELWV
ncbi:unnamed protein product [Acanthoscelides obtectus]|uniref:Dystrophin n=2 Tax=Acanthoscelides obtectus TaxID=200917 RepID=A0A9P0Q7P4_ACAOB|nr:unnamed protein product [Acanthoscelides obtectus]CAK1629504.1 Dystrophin, isoform E [Acanthoscelides obtectus]